MRQTSSAALADLDRSAGEFGTGLRARLAVVRKHKEETAYLGAAVESTEASTAAAPQASSFAARVAMNGCIVPVPVLREK